MSVRAQAWVWDESTSTGNDRIVLLKLADEANDDGASCWPSVDRMAKACRVNRATVMRALARLEADGEILVKRPERHGRGRFNRYVLVMGRDVDELLVGLDDEWSQIATVPCQERREKVAKGRAQTRPDPRPETKPQPLSRADVAVVDRFDEWWSLYPRKVGKGQALAAWRRAARVNDPAVLVDALRAQLPMWGRTETRFVPHPSTWINGQRWLDEIDDDAGDLGLDVLDLFDDDWNLRDAGVPGEGLGFASRHPSSGAGIVDTTGSERLNGAGQEVG